MDPTKLEIRVRDNETMQIGRSSDKGRCFPENSACAKRRGGGGKGLICRSLKSFGERHTKNSDFSGTVTPKIQRSSQCSSKSAMAARCTRFFSMAV